VSHRPTPPLVCSREVLLHRVPARALDDADGLLSLEPLGAAAKSGGTARATGTSLRPRSRRLSLTIRRVLSVASQS